GYTTAPGGSDLQDIHLRDLATGRDLADVVARVKFSGISWTRDGKGFYYARFRGSEERANLRDANTHHQLFYHRLGGAPDRLVFDLAGAPRGEVALPDVGTAAGLNGRTDGSDFFFAFSSYLRPTGVYRYDLRAGRLESFEPVTTPFDHTLYETRATFYQSKD